MQIARHGAASSQVGLAPADVAGAARRVKMHSKGGRKETEAGNNSVEMHSRSRSRLREQGRASEM
jgi:hypothetical protein